MRLFFLAAILFLFGNTVSAQFYVYFPADTARQVVANEKAPEKRYYGYYGLDRYYITNGLFDSCEWAQKEMYSIAINLNSDSLLSDVNVAISNKHLFRGDHNFALVYALKGLDRARDDFRKARINLNIAGIYAWNENYPRAVEYLRKHDATIGAHRHYVLFRSMFYGTAYNGLGMPDSALFYLRKADEGNAYRPDVIGYAQALSQFARAYELKGDYDLADVYYKKALKLCEAKNMQPLYLLIGNKYCNYLLNRGNYVLPKKIALENVLIAKESANLIGIASSAELLQKIYRHEGNTDSSYHYALMQIAYKDSVINQKRITEFQNLTFSQRLKEIDEQAKVSEEETQRKQNIQFALIAFGILSFITLYLVLSRSFITNAKLIRFFGVVALLIVFEFFNLLLHPFLERVTHHNPFLMLLALVCIASLLVPLHHRIEKWATTRLVEKNKQIRLAAARRTIEELEEKKGDPLRPGN
jgi:tetratricopeptide (TPR) repeat protein